MFSVHDINVQIPNLLVIHKIIIRQQHYFHVFALNVIFHTGLSYVSDFLK